MRGKFIYFFLLFFLSTNINAQLLDKEPYEGWFGILTNPSGLLEINAKQCADPFAETASSCDVLDIDKHIGCNYYKCVDAHTKCSEPPGYKNYSVDYGLKYCEKYSALTNDSDITIARWASRTRSCLQDKMKIEMVHNLNLIKKQDIKLPSKAICNSIYDQAFHDHPICYTNKPTYTESICTMKPDNIIKIAGLVDNSDLLRIESEIQIVNVMQICSSFVMKRVFSVKTLAVAIEEIKKRNLAHANLIVNYLSNGEYDRIKRLLLEHYKENPFTSTINQILDNPADISFFNFKELSLSNINFNLLKNIPTMINNGNMQSFLGLD